MSAAREWHTMAKFGLVGVSSTLLYFGLLFLFEGMIESIFFLTSVSYAFSMGYNYLVQGRFTFQSPKATKQSFSRFVIMHGTALVLNGIAMSLLVSGIGMSLYPAQIMVTILVAIGTYVVSRNWVFGS